MAHTTASLEVPATADKIWQLIGGFNSLPDWLPFIPSSELSEGGRVRHLKTADGHTIIERLEAFDEKGRSYSYSIVEAPFPARDYLATISVQEVAGTDGSLVTWSGSFSPVGVSEDEIVRLFHGIYEEGLLALAEGLQAGARNMAGN
ncbi:polyketide cyclase/dehydrase and lipid transport [Caballeronia terrestris]|uniref:Polyketide cyclase/dehydrase and lipid transport n=1 Tax=Caballeronia terrestris TaxID=1226301 RepID=A0A158KF64_9BURK|nr:SRPBCC family protein [Caballeronia terrestris]SAL79778.1 polyketide cyclase/dehydrase and lipid transport [Caballeronia terrestris]